MTIPANQQLNVEIKVKGMIASGGGRAVPISSTFYFRRTTTPASINKSALFTAFKAAILVPLAAAQSSRYTTGETLIRCINDAQDAYQEFFPALTGAIGTDSYSSRNAVYMQLKSGFRGRPYNGSKHFGPLSEIDTTGDVLTGAGLARWQTVQAALLAGFNDAVPISWVPVVVSGPPISQMLVNPTTVNAWDIVEVTLNQAVGSMKKRNAGPVY